MAAFDKPALLKRWMPVLTTHGATLAGPELQVKQGDLTACEADAIVNPANSRLFHGGGAAGAIVKRGGYSIQHESAEWIRRHKELPVGYAMSTTAGSLPCKFVIHTVGPNVGSRCIQPTHAEAQQLREAVWSALCEAERLALTSIAMPGISSGIFGYPRDLAARAIVDECVRFCQLCGATTSLRVILLMNNDEPTCESFVRALCEAEVMQQKQRLHAAGEEGQSEQPESPRGVEQAPLEETALRPREVMATAVVSTVWVVLLAWPTMGLLIGLIVLLLGYFLATA